MRIIQSENPRPLNLLAVGPDGLVAAASRTFGAHGDVEVWDAANGTRRFVHREPRFPLSSLLIHPNGRTLVFSRREGVFALSPSPGEVPRNLFHFDGFSTIAISPDGVRLLVCLNQENDYQMVDGEIACFMFGPQFNLAEIWVTGLDSVLVDHPAFNSDGSRSAVALRYGHTTHAKCSVQLRDTTGALLVTIPLDPTSPVQQLAFTSDGSKLLVRTDSNKVQLFDAATGAAAGELANTGRPHVTGIAVHPKGPVACARTNGTVTFWDAEKREQLRTLDWKAGKLVSVAFSPEGALAAAGTEDGKIVVWDVDL